MPETQGLNHLGLAVKDLGETTLFFTKALGWHESGYDPSYPRTAVSDGVVRLTLWQLDHSLETTEFHRRKNPGLHHLALEVGSEEQLDRLHERVRVYPGVTIEFPPQLVGRGNT